jgi:hypothetical protein
MDLDDEIPIHSAKGLARQLRTANDRLSRNALLSSIDPVVSEDVE